MFGTRPQRIFREAAIKYLKENQHKASITYNAIYLEQLDKFIGNLPLHQIHNGTLQKFINARLQQGRKSKTINLALEIIRHILKLAATEWLDENGLTWLPSTPKIRMLPVYDAKAPYPLSWNEQTKLFQALPQHLRNMALFKVNTGCREQEVCNLRWEWEIQAPELNTSVFIIPAKIIKQGILHSLVKNGEDRLVVLNNIAKTVIEKLRYQHPTHVFTYKNKPIKRMNNSAWKRARKIMNNSAWKRARKIVNLKQVRVHDLKHTFGRRLRAAGVSFEDRQDLLGHKSGRITTHYSAAELSKLIEAANKVCNQNNRNPVLTILKRPNIYT